MKIDMILFITLSHSGFFVSSTSSKLVIRELVSTQKRVFHLTEEAGVSPRGRNSYVFKVRSCDTAIIALSDVRTIQSNKGRYFLLYLGRNHDTQVSILDSCFGCTPKAMLKKSVLSCDVFQPFWLSWNNVATARIGEGRRVGYNTLLSYTSPRPFPIRFSQLTTLDPPTTWRFLLKEDVFFIAPEPDGLTTVMVKENISVGTIIYETIVRPEVVIVMTTKSAYFQLSGTKILTTDKLDFEKDSVHILRLRTRVLNVTTTLTVLVEDENDESPEVVIGEDVCIPEELPVGFIIGGVFKATDKDASDTLQYKLEGEDSIYLSVQQSGQLRIERRIDRDGPGGRTQLNKLQLIVKDAAHHTSAHNISITITDINDNRPICTPPVLYITIRHVMMTNRPVTSFQCRDSDEESRRPVTLHIVSSPKDKDGRTLFWLFGSYLYTDVDKLLTDQFLRQRTPLILQIIAVDTPIYGRMNTANIVVVINLERETRCNNRYTPEWIHPIPDAEGRFPQLLISESDPIGTLLTRFAATDMDICSMITYKISSANYNDSRFRFYIEENTGSLRTTSSLDSDVATGGVKYHDMSITATDERHVITGYLRIWVKNVNDNPPRFQRAFHTIGVKPFENFTEYILLLDAKDNDDNSEVTLHLANSDRRYFRLSMVSDNWALKFRPGLDPREDSTIPPIIRITARDNGSPPRSGQTVVVLTGLPCPVSLSSSVNNIPVLFAAIRKKRLAERVQIGSRNNSDLEGCVTQKPPLQHLQLSNSVLYLTILCTLESLLIILFVLLLVAISCGWFGMAPQLEKSKEEVESEGSLLLTDGKQNNVQQESVNATKTPTHSVISLSTLCQYEVIEKTTTVKMIRITRGHESIIRSAREKSLIRAASATQNKAQQIINNENRAVNSETHPFQISDPDFVPTTNADNPSHCLNCNAPTGTVMSSATNVHRICQRTLQTGLHNKDGSHSSSDLLLVKNNPSGHQISKEDGKDSVSVGKNEMSLLTKGLRHSTVTESSLQFNQMTFSDTFHHFPNCYNSASGTVSITKKRFFELIKLAKEKWLTGNEPSLILPANKRCLTQGDASRQSDRISDEVADVQPDSMIELISEDRMVEMNRSFLVGLHRGNLCAFTSDDVLEVDKKELENVLMSCGRNMARLEAAVRVFPRGLVSSPQVMYLPRSLFVGIVSDKSQHNVCYPDIAKVVEVSAKVDGLTTFKHEAWCTPIAVCRNSRTMFFTKLDFLGMLYHLKSEVVQISRERKQDIENDKLTSDTFWQDNIIANTLNSGSVYLYELSFIEALRKGIYDNCQKDRCACQSDLISVSVCHMERSVTGCHHSETNSKREDVVRKCLAIGPITGIVYLYQNMYADLTREIYSANDVVSLSKAMTAQLIGNTAEGFISKTQILHTCALAFNESSMHYYFLRSEFIKLLSSVRGQSTTGDGLERFTLRSLPSRTTEKTSQEVKSASVQKVPSDRATALFKCTYTHNVGYEKHNEQGAILTLLSMKTPRRKSKLPIARERKKKVKAWDKDVRNRLYGNLTKRKSQTTDRLKKKKKISTEN